MSIDVRRLLCGEYYKHRHYTQRQRIHTAMVMFVAATTSYLVKTEEIGAKYDEPTEGLRKGRFTTMQMRSLPLSFSLSSQHASDAYV